MPHWYRAPFNVFDTKFFLKLDPNESQTATVVGGYCVVTLPAYGVSYVLRKRGNEIGWVKGVAEEYGEEVGRLTKVLTRGLF